MISTPQLIMIIVAVIFILFWMKIAWDDRGTLADRELRKAIKQLKRKSKEVDKLRKQLYD